MFFSGNMSKTVAQLSLFFILQGCILMAFATPDAISSENESPGIIQRTRDAYRSTVDNVKIFGEVLWDYAEMYYEDHLKGRVDPYLTWPSFNYTSMWNRVKARVPWNRAD